METHVTTGPPARRDAFLYWFRLGFINFGGPAGQIALMHEDLVERRAWVDDPRFLHALNYCMLLPGPEAAQLAIYLGWLWHGVLGGLVAGVCFVLPAFFLIMGLSWLAVVHGDISWVEALFYGLQAAVVAIVLVAVIRVGSKALRSKLHYGIAVAAFVALYVFDLPFPLVIAVAALIGTVGKFIAPDLLPAAQHGDDETELRDVGKAGPLRSARTLLTGLAIWMLPLWGVAHLFRGARVIRDEAIFFSQAAMLTFGGAYAVLSYIGEAAVERFEWLLPGQMVTGLGLAESTPGPLIMVTEFVGFVGAYRNPGDLDPLFAGVLGATVTVWATFAPCFLWIFLGAPYLERLRGNQVLAGALSAITAAVVGVIANLAVFFALRVLFDATSIASLGGGSVEVPELATADLFACALAAAGAWALWRLTWSPLLVIGICGLAGLIVRLA